MRNFIFSAFRSLSARSMDRCFVADSISQQVNLAKRIRDIENKPRYLFCKHFVPIRTIKVGGFDVLVDSNGAEAVFSHSANACFTAEYYYRFISGDPDIVHSMDAIILRAITLPPTQVDLDYHSHSEKQVPYPKL